MRVARSGTVTAAPEEVWKVVSDPEHLPRWWPGVERVEEVTPEAWTTVMRSRKGRAVRSDYTLVESEPSRRRSWRHEVQESPFERLLSESITEIELEPLDPSAESTRVVLRARMRLRGFARFGYMQMRLASARQLEGALAGLQAAMGRPES